MASQFLLQSLIRETITINHEEYVVKSSLNRQDLGEYVLLKPSPYLWFLAASFIRLTASGIFDRRDHSV
jgi:hypothetical protein